MCSILTHPIVPVALSFLLPKEIVTPKLVVVAAICSILPDFDVIGFRFGISYQEMLGHRGLSHSIAFAAVLSILIGLALFRRGPGLWIKFVFLFLSTLSHPLLDMLTNGGLGVALFAPISNERYFFPFTPIEVSPLGIGNFLSWRGLEIILNELVWIWLPSAVLLIIGVYFRRYSELEGKGD